MVSSVRFKRRRIEKPTALVAHILLSSLCHRGFKRVAGQMVPPGTVAYYHRLFHRDGPNLIKEMSGGRSRATTDIKKKSKETSEKKIAEVASHRLIVPKLGVKSVGTATPVVDSPFKQVLAERQSQQQEDQIAVARRIMAVTQERDSTNRELRMRLLSQGSNSAFLSTSSYDAGARMLLDGSQSMGPGFGSTLRVIPPETFQRGSFQEHDLAGPGAFDSSALASMLQAQQTRFTGPINFPAAMASSSMWMSQQMGATTDQQAAARRMFAMRGAGAMTGNENFSSQLMSMRQLAQRTTFVPPVNDGSHRMQTAGAPPVVNFAGMCTSDLAARMIAASQGDPQLLSFYMLEHQRQLGRHLQLGLLGTAEHQEDPSRR